MMTDEEIIDHALERYERPLISYAKAITGEIESARDAVQETFVRLSRQDLASLSPRLAPWLFFVCRNCALDHCRKIVRFSGEPVSEDHPSADPSPAQQAQTSDETTRLRGMLARLPERQRELVQLRFEAGLSYREISDATRLSISNVGVQLHEALKRLRIMWNHENAEVLP